VTCGRWTCTTYLLVSDADQQVQTGRPAQVDRFSEQAADRDDHGKPLRRWKAHPLYCTGVMADHELTPPEPLKAREAMIAIPFKDEGAKRQTLAGDLLAQVPPLVNWVKFLDPKSLVPFIAPVFDLLFRWAVAGLTLDVTIESWNALGGPAPRHA
jgi:hypothetical protein